jgi:NTP pyrophosphatase (non-canonical NTP hydrolase)
MTHESEIQEHIAKVRSFAEARDWEKFHTPKNLAMAIAGEAGELAAEFQWLTPEESNIGALSNEKIRDILKIDISQAVTEKMEINESRF